MIRFRILRIFIICYLMGIYSVIFPTNSYSYSLKEFISISLLNGKWDYEEKPRSAIVHPFCAYIDNSYLIIENEFPYYDLNIRITSYETGEDIYNIDINKESSSYISLIISTLETGRYNLTISNAEAGWISGDFEL